MHYHMVNGCRLQWGEENTYFLQKPTSRVSGKAALGPGLGGLTLYGYVNICKEGYKVAEH